MRWTPSLALLAAVGVALAVSAAPADPPREAGVVAQPRPVAVAAEAPATPQVAPFFAPELRPKVRRLPYRPSSCNAGPPPGRWTVEVVRAVRDRSCAEALVALSDAMAASPDHCGLFREVWACFVDGSERLERVRAPTLATFLALLPAFEGPRPSSTPYDAPALGGIELALEAWAGDPQLRKDVDRQLGAPTVADQLLAMLDLEMAAAEALARASLEDPQPEVTDALRRRVHVLEAALGGPIGDRIDDHRTAAGTELRERLAKLLGPDGPQPG